MYPQKPNDILYHGILLLYHILPWNHIMKSSYASPKSHWITIIPILSHYVPKKIQHTTTKSNDEPILFYSSHPIIFP